MSEEEKLEQIERLKREWAEETLKLKPLESGADTLNNSANIERFKLEEKYRKKIAESKHLGDDYMTKLIKTLNIQNAQLNVITAGRRIPLASFSGRIEITEKQIIVPVLGRKCKGEKKIYASFILSEDIDYKTDNEFNSGKVYEAVGDVLGETVCEQLIFSGLRFEDMDPINGAITLEVTDLELIRKMLGM